MEKNELEQICKRMGFISEEAKIESEVIIKKIVESQENMSAIDMANRLSDIFLEWEKCRKEITK